MRFSISLWFFIVLSLVSKIILLFEEPGIMLSSINISRMKALWSEYFVSHDFIFCIVIHVFLFQFHNIISLFDFFVPTLQEYSWSWYYLQPCSCIYYCNFLRYFNLIFRSMYVIIGRLYCLCTMSIFVIIHCSFSDWFSLFGTCIIIAIIL